MLLRLIFIFIIYSFGCLGSSWGEIISVSPQNLSSVPKDGLEIKITFDVPVVESEVIPGKSFLVMANFSGVLDGDLSFSSDGLTLMYVIKGPLAVGEIVSVNLSKQITAASAGLRFWEFRIRALQSNELSWEKLKTIPVAISGDGPILNTYGSFAGDLNHDGWHDITILNEFTSDLRIYMNDGQGDISETPKIFEASSQKTNAASRNEGGDFNLDGHLDLAVAQYDGSAVSMMLGDGTGNLTFNNEYFVGGSSPVSNRPRGLCALDLNRDNYYDLVSANRVGNNISILINKGDGTFSESVELEAGVNYENACASGDFNGDGLEDVVIGGFGRLNDQSKSKREDASLAVLLGDGEGGLDLNPALVTPVTDGPYMIVTGDINNDNSLDLVMVHYFSNKFSYFQGDGKGQFSSPVEYPVIKEGDGFFAAGVAIDLGDVNGDDYLDVVTSNLNSDKKFTLYLGGESGTFNFSSYFGVENGERVSADALIHDRDNDGDLDITTIDEGINAIDIFDNKGEPEPIFVSQEIQVAPDNFIELSIDFKNQRINYQLKEGKPVTIELYNNKGDLIYRSELSPNANYHNFNLRLNKITQGIFFIRATDGKSTFSTKWLFI